MSRLLVPVALLAIAGSAFLGIRTEAARKETEQSIRHVRARLDAVERQTLRLKEAFAQIGAPSPAVDAAPPDVDAAPVEPETIGSAPDDALPPPEMPKGPAAPILTNSMREIVVDFQQCALANRTLRCTFTVTNRSPAEKKFVMGVGGTSSRFENTDGGTSVFDDLGNDFLSAGGGVANHAHHNCDSSYRCEVEKTLTSGVRTAGWLRFDGVDPKVSSIKLLRLKWTDGEAWVAMDFRGIPLVQASG